MKFKFSRFTGLLMAMLMAMMLMLSGCGSSNNDKAASSKSQVTSSQQKQEKKQDKKQDAKQEKAAPHNGKNYTFRNKNLLDQHFEKHGKEFGSKNAQEYEKAAAAVVTNPKALHKKEKESKDDAYYIEKTNEFVVVSPDGYIRTYFKPSAGKKYFDRQ